MVAISDLVHQTCSSTGSGDLILVAVNGKRTFATAFGTGGSNVFDYFIASRDAFEWEVGTGHMSDSTTLVRDTILSSSNSDLIVTFSGGVKDVSNDIPAAEQVRASQVVLQSILTTRGDLIRRGATVAERVALGTSGHVYQSNGTDVVSGQLVAAAFNAVAPVITQAMTSELGTASSPQFTAVNVGHASDTTITRSSAGVIAVEGVTVPLNSTSSIHTAQQIELGAASDTTLTRTGAGDIAVEGNAVYRAGGTDVPVTDGGTGSSTASGARSNLSAAVTGANGDITSLTALTGINTGPIGGWRNLLINPGGRINQRAPATNADDTYGHDRWYALTQTSTIAVSTVSDAENGTPKMWRLTQSQASAQRMGYAQIIEGANCKYLRGKSVTLGGRIKFSLNAAVRYAVLEWTGTEDAVTSDVVNDWTSSTYTGGNFFVSTTTNVLAVGSLTPSAATLTDLTALTAAVGSSCNNLIVFLWTEGTAAQNATLDGALQLEIGSVASQREHRPIGVEIELCGRYFRVVETCIAGGYSTTLAVGSFDFSGVPMFATPTLTLVTAGLLVGNGAVTAPTSIANVVGSGRGVYFDFNAASGLTAASAMQWRAGRIEAVAEL